ncbi:MAG: putative quinol monooxygenase [Pseudomonadota bacterium]
MYVVTVTFRLAVEHAQAFLAAVRENAQLSLAREPGCHRFDVAVGEDGPETVFLYELYDDRAAFDAHLASAHFKSFDAMVAPWVASKDVATYVLTD